MLKDDAPMVFIAYAAQDLEWVQQFYAALRDGGINAWLDLVEIRPGDRWKERIENALGDAETMVFVLTPNSVTNHWMLFELGAAIARSKRIIPVVAETFDRSMIPPIIGRYAFLEETSPVRAARKVAEVVAEPA
jgi:hypothetical protein